MTNLKRLFDNAWKAAEHRSWVRGVLGRPNGDDTYTVQVADRPGFYYVRVAQGGGESVTIARALGKVAARANLPVRMRLEPGNTYVIEGVDPGYYDAATSTDDTNEYGVTAHTHRIGTGLEYEIEPERFEPGRVYPDSDMSVYVNPFRYHWNGAWHYWPGDRIDLTSEQPATTGKWAWVLVGVDPQTNTAVAVGGAEQDAQADLTPDLLDDIAFSYYIPCGAVQVAEADTALADFARYHDAHAWYTAHHDFNDSEGAAADVTTATPADGTSVYAARRDHAHGLANDAVTNAKLANMAQATVKARKALAGTGDPIDVTLVDGPEVVWVWASPADELTLSLASGSISLAKLGDIASDRLLGRDTAGSGAVEELTVGGGVEFSGSGGVQRSALTGDVTASAGDNATTIANDAVTNAKLANMAEATIKGRAAGAGTGDPTDLTAAQVRAIIGATGGGTLHVNMTQAGNVGTGEDTLASYTVPAGQLAANGDTLWFEAFGTMAANANSKTVRVRFGSSGTNLIYEQTNTGWGEHWSVRGRIYRTGASAQKASVDLISDNDDRVTTQTTTGLNQDVTATVTLVVTAEAVADNDVVLEGLIVGWQPAP